MALVVSDVLCPQNHKCPLLTVCRYDAITQEGNALPTIDAEKCVECGKCVKYCGMGAVHQK